MINNSKMDGFDVLCKFYQLSEEEQKEVLKRIIYITLRNELVGVDQTPEDIDKATTSFVKTLYSDDEELKIGIFNHFVENYEALLQKTKEEMCGFEHNFTEWEKDVVERPHYDLDKDGEECYAPIYTRVCNKCGFKQVAYSKSQRKDMEAYTEYRKKLINKPNKEN